MSRKNLFLLGVLVVLIAAAYIYQGPYQDWKEGQGEGNNVVAGVEVEQIESITFQKANATTTVAALQQDDQGWKLADSKEFYIKDSSEKDLEQALQDLSENTWEVVSTNAENKEEFHTGTSSTHMEISLDGEETITLAVGKTGPDLQSSYISVPDSSRTYLVDSEISSLAQKEQWGDPVVFDTDKENITELRFQYPDNEFVVRKENGEWRGTSPYNFQVSQDKIEEVVDIMADLTAADIPAQEFEGTGLSQHLIIVEASGEEVNNTLMVGESNDQGAYYAKKGKSDNIYLITEQQRDTLKTSIEELR